MPIFGEWHLRVVMTQYEAHYNRRRPHHSRELRPPQPHHPAADLSPEPIKRRPVPGGLPNEYKRGHAEAQVNTGGRVLKPDKLEMVGALDEHGAAAAGRGVGGASRLNSTSSPVAWRARSVIAPRAVHLRQRLPTAASACRGLGKCSSSSTLTGARCAGIAA